MPGKLEIDIKGKGAYDIAGSNFGNMMPSEYVELAAAFTAAAAGKSGVHQRYHDVDTKKSTISVRTEPTGYHG